MLIVIIFVTRLHLLLNALVFEPQFFNEMLFKKNWLIPNDRELMFYTTFAMDYIYKTILIPLLIYLRKMYLHSSY